MLALQADPTSERPDQAPAAVGNGIGHREIGVFHLLRTTLNATASLQYW